MDRIMMSPLSSPARRRGLPFRSALRARLTTPWPCPSENMHCPSVAFQALTVPSRLELRTKVPCGLSNRTRSVTAPVWPTPFGCGCPGCCCGGCGCGCPPVGPCVALVIRYLHSPVARSHSRIDWSVLDDHSMLPPTMTRPVTSDAWPCSVLRRTKPPFPPLPAWSNCHVRMTPQCPPEIMASFTVAKAETEPACAYGACCASMCSSRGGSAGFAKFHTWTMPTLAEGRIWADPSKPQKR
mmetsp:Transcript_4140/g.9770  ORF Transcript_4140/g.9770 Transcript_4140/m.9770 type:complete len:240 (-) Transcript_4140:626-1345(-)